MSEQFRISWTFRPHSQTVAGSKTQISGTYVASAGGCPAASLDGEHMGEEAVADKYTRLVGGTSVSFARNPDDHYAVRT